MPYLITATKHTSSNSRNAWFLCGLLVDRLHSQSHVGSWQLIAVIFVCHINSPSSHPNITHPKWPPKMSSWNAPTLGCVPLLYCEVMNMDSLRSFLVGGWSTLLQNMKVSWDDYSQYIYISICIYIYVYIYGKKCSKPSTSCCSSHPRLLALTWQAPHRGYPKVRFWTSSHVARHWGLPQLGIQIAAGCIPVLSSPHYMPILLGFVANVFLVIHGIGSKYIGKYAQNILLNMFVLLWYT